ncbi:melatonin receptor type 1A-like [Montipora foliosa]|uniref:melatonin receptor type 1A-like n=1 Tax=Montipora foliosa TaxID=591990 RepID=UPI0035F1DE5F
MSETADKRQEILTEQLLNRHTLLVVVEFTLFCIINIISIVGNVSVLMAFYRNPRLRTSANFYIVSLAVGDIILATLAMPLCCVSAFLGRWIFGNVACWLQASLAVMLGTTSLVTLALIAANRLLTVVYPNTHRRLVSKTTILLSLLFASFATAAVPLLFYLTGVTNIFHPGFLVCLFDFSSASYSLVIPIAVFETFLPYQVIFVCYFKIWRFLRNHNAQMFKSRVNPDEIRLNRLLALIVISFTVCFTPISVVILVECSREKILVPREVYVFATVMVGLAICVNPFIYGIMNSQFRREFAAIFRGRRARKIGVTNSKPQSNKCTEMHSVHLD